MRDPFVYALLGLGVLCAVVAAVGLVAMRTVFDRIHYLGPALTAAVLFCAAIAVRQSASLITVKAVTLTLFLLVTSPGLSHVLGRAARIAEHGDWKAKPDEPGVREDR